MTAVLSKPEMARPSFGTQQVVMTVQRTPQGRGNRGRRKQRVGKAFLISQGQANHFLLVDGLQGCGLHG